MRSPALERALKKSKTRTVLAAAGVAAVVGAATFAGGLAFAAGGLNPPAENPAVIYAPSAIPDRVILTPSSTPAVTQNVSWRTAKGVAAKVQLSPLTKGPVTATGTFDAVTTVQFSTDLGYDIAYHTATMTGLAPATGYLYRVGDGETWSEWFEFQTAADGAQDFSFLIQGDAQNDIKAYASRTFRAAFEARPYAKAVVHLGDLIDTDVADAEWGGWNEAAGFQNGYLNVLAAPGNHEYYPGPQLTKYWGAQFEYPRNGPTGSTEVTSYFDENTYYVDYQGVRFVSLNANAAPGALLDAETAWLDQVLASNPNQWTVAYMHQPLFSVTSGRDNKTERDAWLPLFEKYDTDLVLAGHDHAYGRGNLIANEKDLPAGADAKTSQTGPVYMVTVAGPKAYIPDPVESNNWITNGANMRSMNHDAQMYQTVDVTDGEMHVESHLVTGELYDGFTITKKDGAKLVTDDLTARASGPGSERAG